jgi:hypothetical protein
MLPGNRQESSPSTSGAGRVPDFLVMLTAADAAALEERAIRRRFARGQALCHGNKPRRSLPGLHHPGNQRSGLGEIDRSLRNSAA